MTRAPSITAKKSFRDGCVKVCVQLKCHGYGDSAQIVGSPELSSDAARALARSLIDLADQTDAKIAAKAASEARREVWHDREVAAGRIKVMTMGEVLRRACAVKR